MSQPINNQYQAYPDSNVSIKSGPLAVNGQSSATQHFQNGMQSEHYNSAGTPSSQSSKDPSREASRDPSPTPYFPDASYRPQMRRPQNGNQMDHNWRARGPVPPQNPIESIDPNSTFFTNSGNYNTMPNVKHPETVTNCQPQQPISQINQPFSSNTSNANQSSNASEIRPNVDKVTGPQYTLPTESKAFNQSVPPMSSSDSYKQSNSMSNAKSNPNPSLFTNQSMLQMNRPQPTIVPTHAQFGQQNISGQETGQRLLFEQNPALPQATSFSSPSANRPVPSASQQPFSVNQSPSVVQATQSPQNPSAAAPPRSQNYMTSPLSPPLYSTQKSQPSSNYPFGGSAGTQNGPSMTQIPNSTQHLFSPNSQTNQFNLPNQDVSGLKSASSPQFQYPMQQKQQYPYQSKTPMQQPVQQQQPPKLPLQQSQPPPPISQQQEPSAKLQLPPMMPEQSPKQSPILHQLLQQPLQTQPIQIQPLQPPLIKQQLQSPQIQTQQQPPQMQQPKLLPMQQQQQQLPPPPQLQQPQMKQQSPYQPSPLQQTTYSPQSPLLQQPTANIPGFAPYSQPGRPGSNQLHNNQQYPPSQMNYTQSNYEAQVSQNTANSTVPPKSAMPPGPGQIKPPPMGLPHAPLPGQNMINQYDSRPPPYPDQMSNVPLDNNMSRRYPQTYPDNMSQLNNQMSGMTVTKQGFNKLLGMESVDLLQCRNILPLEKVEPPKINLHQEFLDQINCSPDIFRCTLTKIPESNELLQKSRLPLGVLIHPFKDLSHLPVIHCSTIVRCRVCRTYINPFVYFVDSKKWKCTLCHRINDLPSEFQFDPVTRSYGDPSRRPEVRTSTIEFIAPTEYMNSIRDCFQLRPPQPAVYLFVLDVSRLAVESGYLSVVCNTITEELTKLPGDSRTQVGFLAVDSAIHFYSMPEKVSQPHEMIMLDVDDVFLPCPENLIVNLKEREDLIRDLLAQLPSKFQGTHDTSSALGAALQVAVKLMSPTGGRVTVFQTCLPNLGPGALQSREDPNTRSNKDVPHLNPATDFYKRLALDCSGQQIAMDLFLLNCQYSDLATLSGVSKFSGGTIYHMPLFQTSKPQHADTLERMLRRYLTRKIGFEAVMRIRCTSGLSIHTFHGNFFVRSSDLLSLPNINPDAGFGMQVSIEESLSNTQNVCFQAALLYTSSKGERRIRVHTLCLPVVSTLPDVLYSADQQCIVGLLAKMAVDKSQQSSLSDARDALINAAIDVLSAFKLTQSSPIGGSLVAPHNLKLLPLYIVALLKHIAFRSGLNTRLDDRVFAMCQLKTLPLCHLMQSIYPDLYPIYALDDRNAKEVDGKMCPQPPRLNLSAEKLDSQGAFLLDAGDKIFIYIGKNIHPNFCTNVLGVPAFSAIPEEVYSLPEVATLESERLRNFVFSLQEEKPYYATLQIIRDDSHFRTLFTERLIEDRFESALSYFEFLQHLKTQLK